MIKSNSKTLYRFTKVLKEKQNAQQLPEDSFDVLSSPPKKKNSHNRTQSQPFANCPSLSPKTTLVHERQNSQCSWNPGVKLQKHSQKANSASLISMETKTVIIRDVGLQQMSSLLWRGGKKSVIKKGGANLKAVFSKNQVNHQIRSYQLRQQLKEIDRKNQEAALKQRILQSLLSNCERISDNIFEFA